MDFEQAFRQAKAIDRRMGEEGHRVYELANLTLANENYDLDIIDITKYAHTKNALIRLRGRVIGQEGRSRKFIEKHTKTYISVYGKTISIIGTYENLSTARRAIIMLLEGAKHPRMYGFLEDLKKKR